MTTSTDITSLKGGVEGTDEQARKAVHEFRRLQPTLTAYARVITKNPHVRVEMAARDNGSTDGKRIFYRPPIALGRLGEHRRMDCGKRDSETMEQVCPACLAREDTLVTIYHEIAHIAFESFAEVDIENAREIAEAAAKVGSTFSTAVAERIRKAAKTPYAQSYIALCNVVSPFMPLLWNALEDARVNQKMFDSRPGTKVMFDANTQKIFREGVEQKDAAGNIVVKKWDTYPLNMQVLVGLFCKVSGYTYEGWFRPEVEEALNDPELTSILSKMPTVRSAKGIFSISFPVLNRLRELGFCRSEEDPPEPEPQPEENSGPSQDQRRDDDSSSGGGEDSRESRPSDSDAGGDSEDDNSDGDQDGSDREPGDDSEDAGHGGSDREASGDDSDDSDVREESDDSSGASEPGAGEAEDPSDAGDSISERSSADVDDDDGSAGDDGTGSVPGEDVADDASRDSGVGDEEAAEEPGSSAGEGGEAPEELDDSGDASGDGGSGSGGGDLGDADSSVEKSDESAGITGTGDIEGDTAGGESEVPPSGGEDREGSSSGADSGGMESPDGDASDELDGGAGDERGDDSASSPPVLPGSEGDDTDDSDGPGSPEDSEDDLIDTGADDGQGGTELLPAEGEDSPPPAGTPEEVRVGLLKFGDHDEKPKTAQEVREEQAVDVAIMQGLYFETPSADIHGVREHFWGRPHLGADGFNYSQAWDGGGYYSMLHNRRKGVDTELVIPEQILGPALLRMRVAFADNKRGRNESHLKKGKVNPKVLGKRAWSGDERLFRKKIQPGKKDYHVIIGMDVSGSTVGMNLHLEKRAVMAQAELCRRMGINFSIYAHSGNFADMGKRYYERAFMLEIYHIKDGDEPWDAKTQERLHKLGPDAANLDGHFLEYLRKRADERWESDCVILYYSDGKMPAENHDEELEILQREIRVCDQKGYTLLGVGIRTDSPARHGLDTVQVDGDSDVVKVVQHLERRLMTGMRR